MANVDQLKRHLLRAVVEENVDVIQARWPQSLRHRQVWRRGSLVAVAACGLLALSYDFSLLESQRELTRLSPPPARAMGTGASSVTSAAAATRLLPLAARTSETDFPSPFAYGALSPEIIFPGLRQTDLTVFPLPVKKVVIDPGHGGDDPGSSAPRGLSEKEVTLDIGKRLRGLVKASGFEVFLTREKDEAVSLEKRAAFAKSVGGDIFISIHINWIATRETRGVETYYLGPTDDPVALRLAKVENRQSGYSLADFRRLLESVYIDVKRNESRKLAETIQGELVRSLRAANPTLENRAVKTAPFFVLIASEMPAVLAEVSCLSNDEEVQLLASADYRQQIAQALFAGIRAYAAILNHPNGKGK